MKQFRVPGGSHMRLLAAAATAASLTLAVAACGGTSSASGSSPSSAATSGTSKPAVTDVTVALSSIGINHLVFYIAQKEGYFTKNGLSVNMTLVNGDAGSIAALESGSVEFGTATDTPIFVADQKDAGIQVVSPESTFPGQIVMSTKLANQLHITSSTPLKKRLSDLEGRTVGILDIGGGLQYQVLAALEHFGLNPKGVHFVAITPYTSELTALQRGEVQVINPAAPYGGVAQADGYGVIIANTWGGQVPGLANVPFELLATKKSWADSHASVVKAMQNAYQEADTFIHAHPGQAAQVAFSELPKIPLKVEKIEIGTGGPYPVSAQLSKQQFAAMQAFNKLSGTNTSSISYSEAIWTAP